MPGISIEADGLDAVPDRLNEARGPPVHGPATEPWDVRRIFVRDPLDRLIDIPCRTV